MTFAQKLRREQFRALVADARAILSGVPERRSDAYNESIVRMSPNLHNAK